MVCFCRKAKEARLCPAARAGRLKPQAEHLGDGVHHAVFVVGLFGDVVRRRLDVRMAVLHRVDIVAYADEGHVVHVVDEHHGLVRRDAQLFHQKPQRPALVLPLGGDVQPGFAGGQQVVPVGQAGKAHQAVGIHVHPVRAGDLAVDVVLQNVVKAVHQNVAGEVPADEFEEALVPVLHVKALLPAKAGVHPPHRKGQVEDPPEFGNGDLRHAQRFLAEIDRAAIVAHEAHPAFVAVKMAHQGQIGTPAGRHEENVPC